MTSLLRSMRGGSRDITTVDDYLAALNSAYAGGGAFGMPVQQTLQGSPVEKVDPSYRGFARLSKTNDVVFACMLARMQVFSAVRFQWQRMNAGRPSDLFGTSVLSALEQPWYGGTTQDLLTRMIQDADLAGNSYWYFSQGELIRLRPDWVTIVLEARPYGGYRKLAYVYAEGGLESGEEWVVFAPDQVAHFAPIPDPDAEFRGMSWLTPVIREAAGDQQIQSHKQKFFENAATPNMVVSLDVSVTPEKFERFKALMEKNHAGVDNAYKTLYLGGGADATVVGTNFQQLDLTKVQGHSETRIAAAAGTPPVIVGLSEGLAAATYSNYGQARRRFADGTIHPLWQSAAGSLAQIITAPAGARLWYDSRDVPFLREDEKDGAEIRFLQAQTIRQLIDAGYEPASVVVAVEANDYSLLTHTGLFSVQLHEPGTDKPPTSGGSDDPNA